MAFSQLRFGRLAVCAAIIIFAQMAQAGEAVVTELKEVIDKVEHTVVVLENDRVRVEIVPDLQGRVRQFIGKGRGPSLLQGIADYAVTWRDRTTAAGPVKY